MEGHKQLPDLLEISFVRCQVATSGHTDGHDENELKRGKSAPIPKIMPQIAHVVDFGERVDPTVITTVSPLVSLVGDILQ